VDVRIESEEIVRVVLLLERHQPCAVRAWSPAWCFGAGTMSPWTGSAPNWISDLGVVTCAADCRAAAVQSMGACFSSGVEIIGADMDGAGEVGALLPVGTIVFVFAVTPCVFRKLTVGTNISVVTTLADFDSDFRCRDTVITAATKIRCSAITATTIV